MSRRKAVMQEIHGFITIRGTANKRQVQLFLLEAYGFRPETTERYLRDMTSLRLLATVWPGVYRALPLRRGYET